MRIADSELLRTSAAGPRPKAGLPENATLEKTRDGRVIVVRNAPIVQEPKPRPSGFRIVIAYGEKCLSSPNTEELSHNLWILACVAGADQPIVGYFTEVFE